MTKLEQASNAMREALDQPEQQGEAVARVVDCDLIGNPILGFIKTPLEIGTELFTAPQKREWVELSDKNKADLLEENDWYNFPEDLINAAIAAFKEANK